MTQRRAIGTILGSLALILIAGIVRAGWASVMLALLGLLGSGWWLQRTLRLTLVPLHHYRVRYHAPTLESLPAQERTLSRLTTLARFGDRVRLIWHIDGRVIELWCSIPAPVERAFHGMLNDLWPGAVLEAIAELPELPLDLRWWRVEPYANAATNPLDFAAWLGNSSLPPAPSWLVVHWQPVGITLWYAAAGPPPWPARRIQLGGPARWRRGWVALYPWVRPVHPQAPWKVSWPLTGTGLGRSLSPLFTLSIPPTQEIPASTTAGLVLGRVLAGDQPLIVPWTALPAHLLLLEDSKESREPLVASWLVQAGGVGHALLVVDGTSGVGSQVYNQVPANVRKLVLRLDAQNPTRSFRPGLLSVDSGESPQGDLSACLRCLEERMPVFLGFCARLGLTPTALGPTASLLPAWLGISLVAHHSARLQGHSVIPPVPEIPALVDQWQSPAEWPDWVAAHRDMWRDEHGLLRQRLTTEGELGERVVAAVERCLQAAERVLGSLDLPTLCLYAASLRTRFQTILQGGPTLAALWRDTQDPVPVLTAPRPPVILMHLAPDYPSGPQRLTERTYGLYVLSLLEAIGMEADRAHGERLLTVVWGGLQPLWRTLNPAETSRLLSQYLARRIQIWAVDGGWGTMSPLQIRVWHNACTLAVLGAGAGADAFLRYSDLGADLPPGFSCSALPRGTELVVVRRPTGAPLVCTIATGQIRGIQEHKGLAMMKQAIDPLRPRISDPLASSKGQPLS